MKRVLQGLIWLGVSLLGVWAYAVLAFRRGEAINSAYLLIAALCSYAIGYRFYSKWIAARVLTLNERRATPCEVHDDGKDFVKTNKWIVFGHHFAAISGPGPLVGPVLAAQFGYLPSIIWILIGVVLGGAVQDFVILFCSLRRDGKSLGQMVKEELNSAAGYVAIVAILAIMTILLAVLALVVVRALAESPWGVFTVGSTIPIALFMGGYLRYARIGKVLEATAIGVALLLLAVWGGKLVYESREWSQVFALSAPALAWAIILYGLAASILPVWLLLAPRDYLSTFMKLGTIFALAIGILLVLPNLRMPAFSRFIDGSGPVVPGKLFPFCFITIACGAISGFHTLIASGTTPKMIARETHARPIGYGAMCLESLVATMALVAACTLEPGIYLSVNMKGAPDEVVQQVNGYGFPVTTADMDQLAQTIGEKSLFGRTGGAATLAVGMAKIFAQFVSGHGLDLWYHFAIMFEALFILTTLDAGTRVGRYLLQDALGHIWRPLGETRRLSANLLASGLVVTGWGYFLIQGVRDPLGGVSSLWHLFGIANQLLSVIALCLATTVILKMQLEPAGLVGPPAPEPALGGGVRGPSAPLAGERPPPAARSGSALYLAQVGQESPQADPVPTRARPRRAAYALITLVPLLWLLAVTTSAGWEKIFSPNSQIGFLAKARALATQLPALEQARAAAEKAGDSAGLAQAQKAVQDNRSWQFNWRLDATVAGTFLVLVVLIVLLSAREWMLLLLRRRVARLHETAPVWLPACAPAAEAPLRWWHLFALACALAKELSGEADLKRMEQAAVLPQDGTGRPRGHAPEWSGQIAPASDQRLGPRQDRQARAAIYQRLTEKRFHGINRCC